MKRYLLFAGDFYYPSQALGDCKRASDDPAELDALGKKMLVSDGFDEANWYQVVDLETLKAVSKGKQEGWGYNE